MSFPGVAAYDSHIIVISRVDNTVFGTAAAWREKMYAVGQVPRGIFQHALGNLTPTYIDHQSGRHSFTALFIFICELLTVLAILLSFTTS